MSSATQRRRHEVLRAIVADYIASQEPVGSKTLVDRHSLGVSSATIRNDMAALESEAISSSSTQFGSDSHAEGVPPVCGFHQRGKAPIPGGARCYF